MPSIWGGFSSSSSSSSSSKRPLKGKSKSSNDILKKTAAADSEQKRKLTRLRKLRHVTDDEIGLKSSAVDDRSQSWPVSPDSGWRPGSGARTPQHAGGGHWSESAVPRPLPRPEISYPGSSAFTRDPSHQINGKSISPTHCRRGGGFTHELNVDTAANIFRMHFPARSAPSSGCSSPMLSPQRYSRTMDLFHPSFRVSSPLESSTFDRISKSYHVSPMPTPEHSPLHSPKSQSPMKQDNSRNCNGVFVHSHIPESFAARPDINNSNVHPLPRPPTVSRPSPPTIRHSIDKSDFPSVKGQWRRGKPIGRGTYGNVYIATHCETGATCAVKEVEMIPDDPKCAECIKQLEQEIKLLKELKHPNIVQYYGCETIEDRFCIYLEYVHPGSLNKYVDEHCGVMTESIIRNFTRHILSGLAYLHSTNTIHRDIKGPNLLVNASGVVKLADFGLAKHLTGQGIDLSLKGTPHWMAPEILQAVMRKDASPGVACAVDIWSVGCTVIEMLTGKPPWSEYNRVQAMFSVLNRTPPIPETLSAEGKDFLQWCFQRRPEDRASAIQLLGHPFLRSSSVDQNFPGFVQEFSGMKLNESLRKKEMMRLSSATTIKQGKLPLLNSETSRQSCPEYTEPGAIPHHSPPPTLEVLPRISSPRLNCSSNSISPSNVENNVFLRAVNNNILAYRTRETSLY